MGSKLLEDRLAGIQAILAGVHGASASLSSASKGYERQQFIEAFLSQVLPPQYRFGTGDAIDQSGAQTGELDVVVEYPFLPSVPIPGQRTSRLYLAEGIAAVIEVKSNISSQWDEVKDKASQVNGLRRSFQSQIGFNETKEFMQARERIPLFVASYAGWKEIDTVVAHLSEAPIQGILIIDPGIFVSSAAFDSMRLEGTTALWGLVASLHKTTRSLLAAFIDIGNYAAGESTDSAAA